MDHETASAMRGIVRRVTLKKVTDDGQMQTASVEVADGIVRDDVEVMQPYGFASHPPQDGALAIAISIGGDQGDMVILPVANPSTRMGNMPAGAAGMFNASGDKVVILPDGTIEISAAGSLVLKVGGVSLTVSAAGVDIVGGMVTHDGKNIGSTHVHTGVIPGGGNTGVPAG